MVELAAPTGGCIVCSLGGIPDTELYVTLVPSGCVGCSVELAPLELSTPI
jgi:hypothetical protein